MHLCLPRCNMLITSLPVMQRADPGALALRRPPHNAAWAVIGVNDAQACIVGERRPYVPLRPFVCAHVSLEAFQPFCL